MDIQFIIAPAVGLLIGGLTNSLAIKMLFRPKRAHYIGKFRLPLTPGLIPKEQPRLAKAIGDTVARELLSKEALQQTLVSDSMQEKIGDLAENVFNKYYTSQYTLREELYAVFGAEATEKFYQSSCEDIAALIYQKLNEGGSDKEMLRELIASALAESSSKGIMKKLVSSSPVEKLAATLSSRIYKKLAASSATLIKETLRREGDKLLDSRTSALLAPYQAKLPDFRSFLIENYTKTVNEDLGKILEAINISGIVEAKLNSYDTRQLEELINQLAKKELNAIVAIGAILGFVMGFLNIFLGRLF